MKPHLHISLAILACLPLLFFASCVMVEREDAPNADCPVTFSQPVVTAARTKAAVTGSLKTYPKEERFKVYAFYSPGDFNGWNASNGSLYMDAVECSYDAALNGWKPSTTYYWPKNGKLTFAAYSPSTAISDMTSLTYGEDGIKITGFQVLTTQDAANKQYDLLYSERSMNKTSSTGGTTYSGADLNFRHALCTVRFKFRSSQNFEGGTSTVIKGVEILNVYTRGNFEEKINTLSQATYSATPEWTAQTSPVNYPAAPATLNQTVTKDTKDLEGGYDLILMPQMFDHGSVVHVTIKVTYDEGAVLGKEAVIDLVNGFDSDNDGTGDSYFNDGTNEIRGWEPGKRYTYTITFGKYKILFTPAVDPWKDGGESSEDM